MESTLQKRRHLLIAGTGRAGTSLLVKLLTACGLETELSRNPDGHFWDEDAGAGLETIPVLPGDHPYVVKSPWSYQFIDQLLETETIQIDAVLVPVRNLAEAAASRIVVELQHIHRSSPHLDELQAPFRDWAAVSGGVTYSLEPIDQARILGLSLHLLLERLMDYDIPIVFLKFPRFTRDLDYLYKCLSPILPASVQRDAFEGIARSVIDPEKVRVSPESGGRAGRANETPCAAQWPVALPSLAELDNLSLRRELQAARQANGALLTQRDDRGKERDALAEERDMLRSELASLRDAIGDKRSDLARALQALRSECEARAVECNTWRERFAALEARYNGVLRSLSWKVTAPLRSARSLFSQHA